MADNTDNIDGEINNDIKSSFGDFEAYEKMLNEEESKVEQSAGLGSEVDLQDDINESKALSIDDFDHIDDEDFIDDDIEKDNSSEANISDEQEVADETNTEDLVFPDDEIDVSSEQDVADEIGDSLKTQAQRRNDSINFRDIEEAPKSDSNMSEDEVKDDENKYQMTNTGKGGFNLFSNIIQGGEVSNKNAEPDNGENNKKSIEKLDGIPETPSNGSSVKPNFDEGVKDVSKAIEFDVLDKIDNFREKSLKLSDTMEDFYSNTELGKALNEDIFKAGKSLDSPEAKELIKNASMDDIHAFADVQNNARALGDSLDDLTDIFDGNNMSENLTESLKEAAEEAKDLFDGFDLAELSEEFQQSINKLMESLSKALPSMSK